jgi:Xaa-Pro dipeptidase
VKEKTGIPKTPGEELYRRIGALQSVMASVDVDSALIVHNTNLFYFTGTVQQSYLFIPCEGAPIFFVRKNRDRALLESELKNIVPVSGMGELRKLLADNGYTRIRRLGMELDVLPVNNYFRYLDAIKPEKIIDIWPSVQRIRSVKSEYELNLMREVAVLSDFMVRMGRRRLREGITEIELAAAVEAAARTRGHQGFVRMRSFNQEIYWGHLLSGPDAAYPAFIDSPTGGYGLSHAFPQGAGWRAVKRNEPVIFDLLACMYGYYVDQTRTLAVGSLPDKLEKAHNVALEIEKALEDMIKPGTAVETLYEKARQIAGKRGLDEHFMGYGKTRAGFCGHGIGLELDEFPVITKGEKTIIQPGMVLVLEPKFHFSGRGVVGVEDTFVVTDRGSQKLTHTTYAVDVTAQHGLRRKKSNE